jgi:hypothetical protein
MASPQTSDGFTKYANELLEAKYNTHLNAYESSIFDFLARMTYGMRGRKVNAIALTQFEKGVISKEDGKTVIVRGTGIDHRHICSTLRRMQGRRLIWRKRTGYISLYAINKDYDQWLDKPIYDNPDDKAANSAYFNTVKNNTVKTSTETVSKSALETVSKSALTKETKEIERKGEPAPAKKIYGEYKNVFLTDTQFEELVIKLGKETTLDYIERLSGHIESFGKDKYHSHVATIKNWWRRDQNKGITTAKKTVKKKYQDYKGDENSDQSKQ